jgi:hypothetical protein
MYLPLSHHTSLHTSLCFHSQTDSAISFQFSVHTRTLTYMYRIYTRVCTCMYKHIGFYQLQINLSAFRDFEIGFDVNSTIDSQV